MSNIISNIVLFGTFGNKIYLMDNRCFEKESYIGEQCGGVTQLIQNGIYLLSGARKDNSIYCWVYLFIKDIRFTKEFISKKVGRKAYTNQRMYFDVTEDGRYLVAGDTV
jgi:hypothetical protein